MWKIPVSGSDELSPAVAFYGTKPKCVEVNKQLSVCWIAVGAGGLTLLCWLHDAVAGVAWDATCEDAQSRK